MSRENIVDRKEESAVWSQGMFDKAFVNELQIKLQQEEKSNAELLNAIKELENRNKDLEKKYDELNNEKENLFLR